jgi:hypothetical protein
MFYLLHILKPQYQRQTSVCLKKKQEMEQHISFVTTVHLSIYPIKYIQQSIFNTAQTICPISIKICISDLSLIAGGVTLL